MKFPGFPWLQWIRVLWNQLFWALFKSNRLLCWFWERLRYCPSKNRSQEFESLSGDDETGDVQTAGKAEVIKGSKDVRSRSFFTILFAQTLVKTKFHIGVL